MIRSEKEREICWRRIEKGRRRCDAVKFNNWIYCLGRIWCSRKESRGVTEKKASYSWNFPENECF